MKNKKEKKYISEEERKNRKQILQQMWLKVTRSDMTIVPYYKRRRKGEQDTISREKKIRTNLNKQKKNKKERARKRREKKTLCKQTVK